MIRSLLGLSLAVAVLAGCESSSSSRARFKPKQKDTNLAAYAATVQYPTGVLPVKDQPVTATINKTTGNITIRNFTDKTMVEPRLWVNQVYVLRLSSIGPQSVISVSRDDLYNSSGQSLATQPIDTINKLDLQTEQNLIEVKGPQFE